MRHHRQTPWHLLAVLALAVPALLLGGCDDEGCPAGETDCDGDCVSLNGDRENCGACGNACGDGEACRGGECQQACVDGLDYCDETCVDVMTSFDNCGSCGNACGVDEVCREGSCVVPCPAGQTACDGACFDLTTANAHCGDCETACAGGELCLDSECVLSCGGGLVECDGVCVDPDRDHGNCGGCGDACNDSQECVDGDCRGICPTGQTECDGGCFDLETSREHCGDCDTFCHDGEHCVDGLCELSCGGSTPTVCGDSCSDTNSDPRHCGDCDRACEPGWVCDTGECEEHCSADLDECGGACVNIDTNSEHCGACDAACPTQPGAEPFCVDGECRIICDSGHGDCNHDLALPDGDGCEVDTARDVDHCGYCGNDCSVAHGVAACVRGRCIVGYCDAGYDDCNGDPSDGCEVELETDPLHCGDCATRCTVDALCYMGECRDGCLPGTSGFVGDIMTRVPAGPPITSEYFVAADSDPAGYVYVGGTSYLYRQPKAGGGVDDVEALAGLGFAHMGYAMLIDGDDIYMIESSTTLSTGLVWRISRDGGATWILEDYASFPATPGDDFRAAALYDGRIYLLTSNTSSEPTEVWSVAAGMSTVPVAAVMELSFTGEAYCSALAVDDDHYYVACSTSDRLSRVDRVTGTVEVITTAIDFSSTVNSIFAHDTDGDGTADGLYVHGWHANNFFVCGPAGPTPIPMEVVDFGGGSSNYGLGYDPVANQLWVYDDDSDEFISID